jgi:transcriptional regulator with XRE-family HTH domain
MTINPQTLKKLRDREGMSQEALAELARISKKTIARIETEKVKPNSNSTKKIARALKVEASDLAKDYSDLEKSIREVDSVGGRWAGTYVSRQTDLAFQLVEHLYGIDERTQILMAPMFAALLAEASLKLRRDKLDALEAARHQIRSLCSGHLSAALGALESGKALGALESGKDEEGDSLGEIVEIERTSIERRDVLGIQFNDIGVILEKYSGIFEEPDVVDPLSAFLHEFAARSGVDLDEFLVAFDNEGPPEYRITPAMFEKLTGGQRWAEYALMHGYARIRDIPWQFEFGDKTAARAEWLAARVPPEVRERVEAESAANAKLSGTDVASEDRE